MRGQGVLHCGPVGQPLTAIVIAFTMVTAALGTSQARAASNSPLVVSYLVYADPVPRTRSLPEEHGPSRSSLRESWQWRVFDPVARRETLFLALPSIPTHIRWDPAFRHVEFVIENRIERAAWRLGAEMQEQSKLPLDSTLCDFWWSSASGRWHALTQREIELPAPPGYSKTINIARRWDRNSSGGWTVAAVDTSDDSYGTCFSTERLEKGATRVSSVQLGALLDSMRIGNYQDSTLSQDPRNPDNGWVWIALSKDRSLGLEMKSGFGDSDHAFEPIIRVDRAHARRDTIYAEGQSHHETGGQIAFREHAGFLLATAEFSGAYPAVIDIRTGKSLLRVDRLSARAVWVPAPR